MDAIISSKNVLYVLSELEDESLLQTFCGEVATSSCIVDIDLFSKTVYLCGDLSKAEPNILSKAKRRFVIRQLSYGDLVVENGREWSAVDLGRVPVNVHGVGVLYPRFFDLSHDHFLRVTTEHSLQSLHQSTKPSKAHRQGIYLTPIQKHREELHFRLLRCSTNLSGPTDNFRANDIHIVDALNQETAYIFANASQMNHVLAQTYPNVSASEGQKQTKAKISAHADKTKDMPVNAIMAFCTFYDDLNKVCPLKHDPFDHGYKNISALTKLCFRVKEFSDDFYRTGLPLQFTVTLYPNSVFLIPLSTNRFYTHEIQASELDAQFLPTRLGYVVRCSSAEAVSIEGQTFLKVRENRVKLKSPDKAGMADLRELYAEENRSMLRMDYGGRFRFSMNEGDYKAPLYMPQDEFRLYSLPAENDSFTRLNAAIQFEVMGKGRQGAVLVKTDLHGHVPIVRTTSKYSNPAQIFNTVHQELAEQVRQAASLSMNLNNALIEKYTNAYTTMGFHSDQALDLADDSFIAVYSCYQYPELVGTPRMLVVESKQGDGTFEIPLRHNTVVVFSTDANKRFKHKIVLPESVEASENTWLGVTFRTSKTFIQFQKDKACFQDGTTLSLADENHSRDFYRLRGQENRTIDFQYPSISYTISQSDMLAPIGCENGKGA